MMKMKEFDKFEIFIYILLPISNVLAIISSILGGIFELELLAAVAACTLVLKAMVRSIATIVNCWDDFDWRTKIVAIPCVLILIGSIAFWVYGCSVSQLPKQWSIMIGILSAIIFPSLYFFRKKFG